MICVAGASELALDGLGSFQESLPPSGGAQIQSLYTTSVCKYSAKATDPVRIPFYVEQAVRYSIHGRPGAVYLEVAGDTLRVPVATANVHYPPRCRDPAITLAEPAMIKEAAKLLASAKFPLLIVGKGAAYAGAAKALREFVKRTGVPFLPTPMGKGVIPDDHPLCVSSARSFALKNADVVLLVGARLNWILHYGKPPRYREDVAFIHVELLPEEVGHSVSPAVALVGHAKAITDQLLAALPLHPISVNAEWIASLAERGAESIALFQELAADRSVPMNYYCPLSIIDKWTPKDAVIVNEGSNTMDIGRTVLRNFLPSHRLDAGTWGTMGVGMGQAIAAALVHPDPGCVLVMGDSAFGFSGMEFEVVARYNLPIVVVIVNNNGIGHHNPDHWTDGVGQPLGSDTAARLRFPCKSLSPECRYERWAHAVGCPGVFVDSADALEEAFKQAVNRRPFSPTIINVMISREAARGKASPLPWAVAKM